MQLWPPVEVILIEVAATAPVELDGPVAVTQSPTARLADVVDSVSVTVVVDDKAMLMSEGTAGVGGMEVDVVDLKPKPESLTPSTTMDVEPAETTFPVMMAALARPPPPAKPDPPPVGKLRGGVLPVDPPGAPAPRARPPRPKPVVQLPEDEGCDTVTDRAVTVEPDAVPMTITHVPAFREEAATVATFENLVEDVQVTVSCPDDWLWTSIDVPEMAATDPEVPGKRPPKPPGEAGAVVEVEFAAALDEPPPQAARAAASATAEAVTNRDVRLTEGRALI